MYINSSLICCELCWVLQNYKVLQRKKNVVILLTMILFWSSWCSLHWSRWFSQVDSHYHDCFSWAPSAFQCHLWVLSQKGGDISQNLYPRLCSFCRFSCSKFGILSMLTKETFACACSNYSQVSRVFVLFTEQTNLSGRNWSPELRRRIILQQVVGKPVKGH